MKESGEQLKKYKSKAKSQDKRILEYLSNGSKWSASLMVCMFDNTPITSIRRAFNTLENKGKIKKTGIKIYGSYGRKENMYKLI